VQAVILFRLPAIPNSVRVQASIDLNILAIAIEVVLGIRRVWKFNKLLCNCNYCCKMYSFKKKITNDGGSVDVSDRFATKRKRKNSVIV